MQENSNIEELPEQDVITNYTADEELIEMQGYNAAIRKARNALFWAGGLVFAGEMLYMFQALGTFNNLIFMIALVEAAVFILLAFYTKKKPYTAIVGGLIAYVIVLALGVYGNGINDGIEGVLKALFGGIIVKVLIFVALIRPLSDAKKMQEIMNRRKGL